MSRWIKCGERLPAKKSREKNPAYLWVISASKSGHVCAIAFDPKNQIFTDLFGDEWVDLTSSITHWMPLPEPPKDD